MLNLTLPAFKASGQGLYLHGLHLSAQYLTLHTYLQQHDNFFMLLTPDHLTAQQYYEALTFLNKSQPIYYFTDWETLPYDNFTPPKAIVAARLKILAELSHQKRGLLILPITTLVHPVTAPEHLSKDSFYLKKGDTLDLHEFRQRLEKTGYYCTSEVITQGEFALRGSLLDLFPVGASHPFRIDLFDNIIDSIRLFDIDTQRTMEQVDKIDCLPAYEYPLDNKAIQQFRQQWRHYFSGDPTRYSLYNSISAGRGEAGIEYYLPLFFHKTYRLFDYLPANTVVFRLEKIDVALANFNQEVQRRYEQFAQIRPILPPQTLFTPPQELFTSLKQYSQIFLTTNIDKSEPPFTNQPVPSLLFNHASSTPLQACEDFLKTHDDYRILFSVETTGRQTTLIELLNLISVKPKIVASWEAFLHDKSPVCITATPFTQGIILPSLRLIIITESELFGNHIHQTRRRHSKKNDAEAMIKSLLELQEGNIVVHVDYGIGRYCGLTVLESQGQATEYLALEYAQETKLYVPVSSLHLINRYSGMDPDHVSLHRLGSGQWEKEKRKAAERVADLAAELLTIYAKRAATKGHAFPDIDEQYYRFAAEFPFEETVDQAEAIKQVINDMKTPKTMDRLICGDVGFGKTEVAIRAAFIAVHDKKQVALLTPTTLLTQQHLDTLRDRFANWPIIVESLSRFKTMKEQGVILRKLAEGKIDIIVGTHALLSDRVKFKDLGLLIVDEEHRFGVKHKEKLKALRSQVDILTLTATPIPRSLNLSMLGIRDLSLITTPPDKRLSVKTFVRERDDNLIREAILRELLRGGQVYFLHNRVSTINREAENLQKLLPEARVAIAHGKMKEVELEKVMNDFYHQRTNVLVCSTIIESGIDIPTANTIIMDRADHLGLSQLHQLRGRVGRSYHQAYAYLLTPPVNLMTKDSQRRLDAIASLENLGSGFTLATHDLEIRGAGNLLGEQQSGHINAVGFSFYTALLEKAVKSLEKGETLTIDKLTQPTYLQLELPISMLIPETYLPNHHERLLLYKRIADGKDSETLQELKVEMIDRFGNLPQPTLNLFRSMELRLQGEHLGITAIKATFQKAMITFQANPPIESTSLINLINEQPQQYRLTDQNILTITWPKPLEGLTIIDELQNLLTKLTPVDQQ